jgi:transcriptional pleiotropic regulator of transition state genes
LKSFGIISEIDKVGSVKLPDILLGLCDIENGDDIEMRLEGDNVIMSKYPPACIFCGSEKDLREFRNKSFCCCCADELKNY